MNAGWLQILENSAAAGWARESAWLYPALLSLHLLGVGALFGAALVLDFRLWQGEDGPVGAAPRVAVTGLGVALISGAWLFATDAARLAGSLVFQAKIGVLVVATFNAMIACRARVRRRVHAVISAAGWGAAIVLGRWIGFSV